MEWSTKRKLEYFGVIVAFILVFIVLPFYIFIYEAPTCFDNLRNGKEKGIDCGGACELLCPAEAIKPVLRWDPRVFRVSPGMYSVLAYIENPNPTAEVKSAPYTFKIYDREGVPLAERKGTTFIPKGKTFAVFDGNFSIAERTPYRATFEFGDLTWTRNTKIEPVLEIRNKALIKEETEPRVEATIENKELVRVSNVELVVIIFDGNGNAIASSKTFVEELEKGESAPLVFTWPYPFETKARVCESPVDVAVVIDRSGSMRSLGTTPPQPLTDVKNAAVYFVNQLSKNDQGSLISFATTASQPLDRPLTADLLSLTKAIDAISILPEGVQQTNISDGILKARNELESERHKSSSGKVMVLLTDGIATHPEKAGDPLYPETFAKAAATEAKESGISIFTIGLGKDVNASFLSEISTKAEDYYPAPTTKELNSIYKEIATKICKERPAVIEVISRIYPQ
jgi:Mg-chelatase subunit ChlD